MAGLDGRRGLLTGEKRHRQVDVFGVSRGPKAAADPAGLVRSRLDRSSIEGWRIVGVALEEEDLPVLGELLLDELVAGDLVAVGSDPARILIHRGDRLAPIPNLRLARE